MGEIEEVGFPYPPPEGQTQTYPPLKGQTQTYPPLEGAGGG